MPPPTPLTGESFEIGIVCALPLEADAVEASFDDYWDDEESTFRKTPGDVNAYTFGRIGSHAVVLVHMPGMGKCSAASVAASFRSTFPLVKLTLVVGICGGVPRAPDGGEILLGDVLISPGVVEYDSGERQLGAVQRRNAFLSVEDSAAAIKTTLDALKGKNYMVSLRDRVASYLSEICEELGNDHTNYPGADKDKLFDPAYPHRHHELGVCKFCDGPAACQLSRELTCEQLQCDETHLVPRARLTASAQEIEESDMEIPAPAIHIGLLASGDIVMKSGEHRDEIARREKIIGFEMEGAGVHEALPNVIVVKGVCDYSDSHKNKIWQNYAAASAAACMKAFLCDWRF